LLPVPAPLMGRAVARKAHPFSKIIITSTHAVAKKDPATPGAFLLRYHDDVHVTLADQSTVVAKQLDMVLHGTTGSKQHAACAKGSTTVPAQPSLDACKKITFSHNVCITQRHRKACADKATFYPREQKCLLEGNVSITQEKGASRSQVPVAITSQKAELNLVTGTINFIGSSQKPVSTTIVLNEEVLSHAKNPRPITTRGA